MASALFTNCDDILVTNLANFSNARIDAASFVPDTGLLTLTLYRERKLLLAIGIGPMTIGIGLLPRLPRASASHQHLFIAALHAHLVGTHIRTIHIENHSICITTQSSSHPSARLVLHTERHGSACIFTPTGNTISWPPHPILRPPTKSFETPPNTSLETTGEKLLATNDAYVIASLRRQLIRIIRKKYQRLERRAAAIQQDLARLQDVPHLQKIGSLLLAKGQTIARGTTRAELVDWNSNEIVVVELAPDKPAKEQAAEFFQKARRLQRGASVMQKRLDETIQARDALDPLKKALHNAPDDWNALQEIARLMHSAGLPIQGATPVSSAKRNVPEERKPYHCFETTNGAIIWVGRNNHDNDQLITRFAKPHDLWLHAKNIRGAHVIVPLEKNRSCPSELLVDAATLAAHFSDARNESICEVSYIERRYVRKPKKSPPGSVTVDREKVIVVRIEKNRLAKLLSSKLET